MLTCLVKSSTNENDIHITFDDGPNPYATLIVLDILKYYDVKAAFFIIGQWAETYPDIVKRTYEEGHLIGNHSYSHGSNGFDKTEQIICNIINKKNLRFVRPPFFKVQWCTDITYFQNKIIVLGDVDSEDYSAEATSLTIKNNIFEQVSSGSIITLHDGSENKIDWKTRPLKMLHALPEIIEKLRLKYNLIRLDKCNNIKNIA